MLGILMKLVNARTLDYGCTDEDGGSCEQSSSQREDPRRSHPRTDPSSLPRALSPLLLLFGMRLTSVWRCVTVRVHEQIHCSSPPASAPNSRCLLALSSAAPEKKKKASNYFCILNQRKLNDADVLHERDPLEHPLPSIFINLDMVLTAQQCQINCREQFAKNIYWMICFYLPTTSFITVRLFPCCHK